MMFPSAFSLSLKVKAKDYYRTAAGSSIKCNVCLCTRLASLHIANDVTIGLKETISKRQSLTRLPLRFIRNAASVFVAAAC